MNTKKYLALVAMMIFIILAILLSSCSAIPEYGTIVTTTPAPTITPTPLPSAKEAVVGYQKAVMNRDSTEPIDHYKERLCALATVNGCSYLRSSLFKTVKYGNEHYKIKATAIIESATLLGEGKYSSGSPWQVWEVKASYDNPWPGIAENSVHPQHTFVFVDGAWKYDGVSVIVSIPPTVNP